MTIGGYVWWCEYNEFCLFEVGNVDGGAQLVKLVQGN